MTTKAQKWNTEGDREALNLEKILQKLNDLGEQQEKDREIIKQVLDKIKTRPAPVGFSKIQIPVPGAKGTVRWPETAAGLATIIDILAEGLLAKGVPATGGTKAGAKSGRLDLPDVLGIVIQFLQGLAPPTRRSV